MELVRASLYLLIGVVIVQVVISWVNPQAPLAPVFSALTRPFYAVFRRFVPPIGNVDLSPLFVLLVAQVLLILIENLARAIPGGARPRIRFFPRSGCSAPGRAARSR